jgi:outer membrane murein-binding lipoprotein Lpp
MRAHVIDVIAFAALAGLAVSPAPALAAGCDEGSAEERITCLQSALSTLEEKVATLSKEVSAKADKSDALKWYDRVALMNEDMRIYPRCLDNPGPNSQNITDVFATSCAKVPAQTWMLAKPYK